MKNPAKNFKWSPDIFLTESFDSCYFRFEVEHSALVVVSAWSGTGGRHHRNSHTAASPY